MQVKCKVSNRSFRRTSEPTLQRQHEWCASRLAFESLQLMTSGWISHFTYKYVVVGKLIENDEL